MTQATASYDPKTETLTVKIRRKPIAECSVTGKGNISIFSTGGNQAVHVKGLPDIVVKLGLNAYVNADEWATAQAE